MNLFGLLRDKFRVEKALLAGSHRNRCLRPSILHFSFNKAATQTVKRILIDCGRLNGLTPACLHDYAFKHSMPYLDQLELRQMEAFAHVFKPAGYIYTVFGGMIEGIPFFERFKVVLVIRDPRDILVSGYYSIAYSHAIPDGEKKDSILLRRANALASSLDEHVLKNSANLLAIFEKYERCLFSKYPDVHVARYEDMVKDFPAWLDGLLFSCGLEISQSVRSDLIKTHELHRPNGENIHKHLRKGMPGEHREKLRKETVKKLDQIFQNQLARFNYHN
jgi:hypothetical protein